MEKIYATIEKTLKFTCPYCGAFNQENLDYIIDPEATECQECGEYVELEIEY